MGSTFKTRIARDLARRYGEEAVVITRNGGYRSPVGTDVEIAEAARKSVRGTIAYPPDVAIDESSTSRYDTVVSVVNATTLSPVAGLLSDGLNPVVLNFASATSPGGGFLNGARAQEEYLCRSSALHACLKGNPMYAFHRAQRDALYSDYVIYSPNVPVFRDDDGDLLEQPYMVSVITSPASNARHIPTDHQDAIYTAMQSRIHKVLATGIKHGHDAIVLGAWGCGAFKCDPGRIASLFADALAIEFKGSYRKVVFAIVDWSDEKRFIEPFVLRLPTERGIHKS